MREYPEKLAGTGVRGGLERGRYPYKAFQRDIPGSE
jgi:hypothetical protein